MAVNQNDVLRVTAEMTMNGHDLQNVFHIRSTNTSVISNAKALADCAKIADDWYTFIITSIETGVAFDQVRVQNVTQAELLGAAGWPLLVGGTNANALLPEQVAALITYPTSLPRTRGGVYFGGFTEADNAPGGVIEAGLVTGLTNLAIDMISEKVFGVDSYRYVVFNTLLKTFVLPVSALVHSRWRTQRRRRSGVGA